MSFFYMARRGLWAYWSMVLLVFLCGASAFGQEAVLEIGSGSGMVEDEVTVPVTLVTNGTDPASIIFDVVFNPAMLAYVGYSAGPAATAALKDVDDTLYADRVVFWISNLGSNAIGDGVVVNITFAIIDGEVGEFLALTGANESAADTSANSNDIPISSTAGAIEVSCPGPDAPQSVTASQGNANGVSVTWAQSQGATAYCVYRNTTNNSASASAISAWTASLSYLDTTAAAPTVTGGGCAGPRVENHVYYYWVRARNESGCIGLLSAPAQGYRGQSKAFQPDATTFVESLPAAPGPASSLSVRLRSSARIAPHTVWGAVDGVEVSNVQWVPVAADNADGWVVVRPETAWPVGETVQVTVGAKAAPGMDVKPVSATFSIRDESEGGEAALASEAVPELDRGVGDVFRVVPDEPYDTPREVRLPVPPGLLAQDVQVFYYRQAGDGMGWYAGENVKGWLIPESFSVERNGKADCIVFEVTHGGIVQLGLKPELISGASVLGANIADVLVTLGVLLLLVLIRRRRARTV